MRAIYINGLLFSVCKTRSELDAASDAAYDKADRDGMDGRKVVQEVDVESEDAPRNRNDLRTEPCICSECRDPLSGFHGSRRSEHHLVLGTAA
jgi:hypothetical protein